MPTCEPVQCDQEDVSGELRSVHSFGRRKRKRRSTEPRDDLLLVQSIQITDKFGFNKHGQQRHQLDNSTGYSDESVYVHQAADETYENFCVNIFGIVISCLIFLAVQVAVIIAWTYVWQRNKNTIKESHQYINDGKRIPCHLSRI